MKHALHSNPFNSHIFSMEQNPAFNPPSLVTLSPFTPSVPPPPRRLSSRFSQVGTPIHAARKLAWVDLQGCIVNADEASSSKTIGGGLGTKEAVAWELFSPIHRVLLVAVVTMAAMKSRKNREIWELKKCVELRDQVLSSMQQKLDYLCEQVNYFKDQPEVAEDRFTCKICRQHKHLSNDPMGKIMLTASKGYEGLNIYVANEAEPEERRMSDLSDLNSSVAASSDIQLDLEQDVYNLQKESEEKAATINELSTLLHSSADFGSKRIAELEEIILRKNIIIDEFKKDILVLEQKVVNLTRLRRPSYKNAQSSERKLPFMTENVLYGMDSSTNSSSSDTDRKPGRRCRSATAKVGAGSIIPDGQTASKKEQNMKEGKFSCPVSKQAGRNQNNLSRRVTPLREMSLNPTVESAPIGDSRSRRRHRVASKSVVEHKRWV